MTNHVDGEIWVDDAPTPRLLKELVRLEKLVEAKAVADAEARVPVEPTDLDYRIAALNAAVNHHKNIGGNLILHAKYFERYLRGEAA